MCWLAVVSVGQDVVSSFLFEGEEFDVDQSSNVVVFGQRHGEGARAWLASGWSREGGSVRLHYEWRHVASLSGCLVGVVGLVGKDGDSVRAEEWLLVPCQVRRYR